MTDPLHPASLSSQAISQAATLESNIQHDDPHEEEGNFAGTSIHSTTSEAQGIRENSALDQLMQVIGNPLKAITSIPAHIKSASERKQLLEKLEIEKGSFAQLYDSYAFRGLEKEFNTLMEAYDKALDSQLAPGSYEALQQCKEGTVAAFDQVVQERRNKALLQEVGEKKNSHLQMQEIYFRCGLGEKFRNFIQTCDILLTANAINDETYEAVTFCEKELTTAYANIRAEERNNALREQKQQALGTPGAYHISAAEAALDGIHQHPNARRSIMEPEATPIAVAVPIAVSDQILGQTIKSTRNPQGLSHVKAEPDTLADVEIPADQVFNITPLDQMQELIEERNAEITRNQ